VWGIAAVITAAAFYFFICVEFAEAAKRASIAAAPTSADGITWEPLDLKKLTDDVNGGKTVFLDFTAQWCLTCKVNENTVLATAPVVEKMKALHVVTMRADWTSQDANITKLLNKFNRSGVPLYVIFPAGKATDPIVLPEVITQGIVLDSLDKAGPSK
jgi:thiol:disulfide interchange protein DsbD